MNSLADNIVGFIQILRQLGVRISTAETIDAVDSLTVIDNFDQAEFRAALKSTLIKHAEDQAAFNQAFNLFFVPPEAKKEQQTAWDSKQQLDLEQTKQAEEELVFQGRPLEIPENLKDVYKRLPEQEKQRLQDFLEKTSTGNKVKESFQPIVENLLRSSLSFWQRQLSPEDLAQLAAARRQLLGHDELDHVVDSAAGLGGTGGNPLLYKNMQDIAEHEIPQVTALIKRLASRLTTRISRRFRITGRRKLIDIRKSIRRNMRYGGIMISLKYKTKKIHKPNIIVVCDVSASMTKYVRFTLPLLFGLSSVVKNIESFIFATDLEKVTDYFRRGADFAQVTEKLATNSSQMGQGTNLFIALSSLEEDHKQLLTPSTLLFIISDANTLAPLETAGQLSLISKKVKRVLWLNTQPKERWPQNSAIPLFAKFCAMFECYSLAHLTKILSLNLTRQS
ncbi:VWA domain containing CoxE-like protein [Sporomusa ovata DSM 2662]|uniref:Carbon monoxide oxidation accessory protein CoxE n=1 Tax=Sporomusa ovata TaxID=2378 RepID=A0A0U1L3R1_9FIRM|nr:VWA domain-containing protein [Sporomusa ovata]EQB25744.1 VWA containing CoxE family protein [Sporomusa ovata DSM 2662]CQR74306.1 Carbon monoxide oxidation accessory protein CoxE [Sporomusa ovata]